MKAFLLRGVTVCTNTKDWSGRRESNPSLQFGKLLLKSPFVSILHVLNNYVDQTLQVKCQKVFFGAGGGNRTRIFSLEN